MLNAAAQSIDAPGHHSIEFALCGVAAKGDKSRALVAPLYSEDAPDRYLDRNYALKPSSIAW
jgi:hypothetical protein